MEPCTQTYNIEKLVKDFEELKQKEGLVAVALEKLTNKIDNVDEKVDEILSVIKDHSMRLTKLEKVWLALKWCSIGIIITIAINIVGITKFIQGLF